VRKALIVGIDDYDRVNPLNGCVQDAIEVATTLQYNGDGTRNFDNRLMISSNERITRGSLNRAVEELFQGDNDVSLLYFSGHGTISPVGGKIVTSDADSYDEGISMDDVLILANRSRSRDKIIILDCCFSGAMGVPQVAGGNTTHLGDGVTVLTASRADEPAREVGDHGVFTSLLLDALQGSASDLRGYITPGGVYAFVDSALGAWVQRPVFKTSVSRFTHLRMMPPTIPLEILRKIPVYFASPEEEFELDTSYEDTVDGHDPEHATVFKELQRMVSVGLVKPVGEEHMYYAAMNSKSCRLTALGCQYWRMATENRI